MASFGISTAGMLVKYATGATRPTTGYTLIPGCKALPALFNEPNTLQTTTLEATKNHTYTEGLGDSGGAVAITANDYSEFRTAWATCVSAYEALTSGNQMWFEFSYPAGSDLDSFYFPGKPVELGFGGADVDAVLENNANIMPEGDYTFAAASVVSA